MGQMYCKVCGYRGTAGESACLECGAPLYPVEEAPAPQEPQERPEGTRAKKSKKTRSGKAMLARRAAWLLLICLAVQSLGLWAVSRQRTNDWSWAWGSDLITPQGVWQLGGSFWSTAGDSRHPHKLLRSMDWVLSSQYTPDGDQPGLIYYDGHAPVRTDWQAGTISGDGEVLFYLKSEGEDIVLYRQDLSRGPAREVDRVRGNAGLGIVSAWDGSAAVWLSGPGVDGQRRSLRQWDRKRGGHDLGDQEEENILWLGRDGDSVLLFRSVPVPGGGDWDSAIYLRRGQEERELTGGYRSGMPVLDRELTQVLYPDEEGRYWYEEQGAEPVAVTGLPDGAWLSPLVPEGDSANTMPTYSARRLTDWVYYGDDQHLYYLGDDRKATDLTPGHQVRDYVIDEEGTTLYWSSASGGLFRVDRPGPNATSVQLEERAGWELSAGADLSVVVYTTWQDGKSVRSLLDTKTGETTVLDRVGDLGDSSFCFLRGGAYWRVDGTGQLWFRGPGEKEERQTPLDQGGEDKKLTPRGSLLRTVGDDTQAVLCMGLGGGRIPYGGQEGEAPDEPEPSYWLLDNAGNAARLEIIPFEGK